MGRKQTLIVYPHLNDCGGNMDKDWYVEYKYRIPGNPKQVIERVYKGLQLNSKLERYTKADEIIAEKRKWLNDGKHLTGETKTRLYVDELTYNSVVRLYGKLKNEIPTIRQNVSEYLAFIKTQKTYVTYSNIQTKLRVFVAYCELKKLNLEIRDITRKHIIDFQRYIELLGNHVVDANVPRQRVRRCRTQIFGEKVGIHAKLQLLTEGSGQGPRHHHIHIGIGLPCQKTFLQCLAV